VTANDSRAKSESIRLPERRRGACSSEARSRATAASTSLGKTPRLRSGRRFILAARGSDFSRDAGFTLLDMLVALLILRLAALTLARLAIGRASWREKRCQ